MHPIAYGRTVALREPVTARGGIDPRLKPAAHEFEASLMQELLRPMEHDPLFSDDSSSGGLLSGDAGMSSWSSLGTQSLAKALSDAGGLGIATTMIQEVEAEAKEKKKKEKISGSAKDIGDMRVGKTAESAGISLSAKTEHLHSWSTVRHLP